jgi:hypothetical protein
LECGRLRPLKTSGEAYAPTGPRGFKAKSTSNWRSDSIGSAAFLLNG